MRNARLSAAVLTLVLVSIYLQAQQPEQKITLTGKLVRAMAIGGESTGWVLELESSINIGGKPVNSIQVDYRNTAKLKELQNKLLRATGKLAHREGVEAREQPVLKVSSIREVNVPGEARQ